MGSSGFFSYRTGALLVVAGLTALVLLLPTANATLDAWYYAACVRWQQDVYLPHHLLYNALGIAWVRLLPGEVDVRLGLTALNALLYGAILLALRPLLRAAGAPPETVAPWLLVVGSTFGLLRFATENEAYLAPLLCSVLASGAWAKWARSEHSGHSGWLVLAGALAAGACLLHQLHVWWWLALGLSTWWGRPRRWRATLLYAAPALLVPLAYVLAAGHAGFPRTVAGLTRFVLHDYVVNEITPTLGGKTLLLTGINLLRTLGQAHGSTLLLLQRWPVLAVVPVAVGALLWQARRAWIARRDFPTTSQRLIWRSHALALGLHGAFAAANDGNAEFMVMLPVLGAILAVGGGHWRPQGLKLAGAALLLWNLTFGLLPTHFLRMNASAALAARVRATPSAYWLLTDQHLTENRLIYDTGRFQWPRLRAAPTALVRRDGGDARVFRQWLTAELLAARVVYTDALGPPRPGRDSRAGSRWGRAGSGAVGGGSRRAQDVPPSRIQPWENELCVR
ncbi:MAG: hypothetical protein H7330_04265 [Hymenobacteraceae bacterium]|nr:hypothetical protein [Hymenobacteraceae bacterium]